MHTHVFLLLITLSVFAHGKVITPSSEYSFAVLSDIHIGGENTTELAHGAVGIINKLVEQGKSNGIPVKFVTITGDLTNSAMPWQMQTVREILDRLTVPYIPVFGNHDVWPYNSTWEDYGPTGDALFAETFKDIFATYPDIYSTNATVWNPTNNIYSWFQNWQLELGKTIYFGLDWNSRSHAVGELGYKGAWPGADLHDFEEGTFQWLRDRLRDIAVNKPYIEQIVTFQHHVYRAPFPVPDFIYCFSGEQKAKVVKLLQSVGIEKQVFWGNIAGHFHMWENQTAFDQWPEFHEWETDACKNNGAVTYVHVKDDHIVEMKKYSLF